METTSSYKKCPKCGTFNTNKEICTECGEILSYKKKQELKEKAMRAEQIKAYKEEQENPSFVDRMKNHNFFLVKIFGYLLYSVFLVVSVISSALAWLIAMVLAG